MTDYFSFGGNFSLEDQEWCIGKLEQFCKKHPEYLMYGHVTRRKGEYSGYILLKTSERQFSYHAICKSPDMLIDNLVSKVDDRICSYEALSRLAKRYPIPYTV